MKKIASFITLFVFANLLSAQSEINNGSDFLGTWSYNSGKETIKISKENKKLNIKYISWTDGYEPRDFLNCSFENNQITGDFWGGKKNVKLKMDYGQLSLTLDPFHYSPIIDQKFTKVFVDEKPPFVLRNEQVIFSFKTEKNKNVIICVDSNYNYLVYRFGTDNKVELQHPSKLDINSWDLYSYEYYMRGGGAENTGLDLNNLSFENKGYRYEIINDWSIENNGEHQTTEIKITNINENKVFIIKGNSETIKGGMSILRFDWKDFISNNK